MMESFVSLPIVHLDSNRTTVIESSTEKRYNVFYISRQNFINVMYDILR